jgi:hypothetical protein
MISASGSSRLWRRSSSELVDMVRPVMSGSVGSVAVAHARRVPPLLITCNYIIARGMHVARGNRGGSPFRDHCTIQLTSIITLQLHDLFCSCFESPKKTFETMLVSSKLFPEATKSSNVHTLVLRNGKRSVLVLLPKTYQVRKLFVICAAAFYSNVFRNY